MNTMLNKWISSLDDSKRELFVDTLYQVIKATGATTFYDLTGDWQKKAVAALKAIKGIDEDTRIFVLKTIGSLFVLAVKIYVISTQEINEDKQMLYNMDDYMISHK